MLVDIPKDVTGALADYEFRPVENRRLAAPPKEERIRMTLELLASCQKPLIYFGGGVILSEAEKPLLELAEKLDIPVCASMMGLGGFPARPPAVAGHGGDARNSGCQPCRQGM